VPVKPPSTARRAEPQHAGDSNHARPNGSRRDKRCASEASGETASSEVWPRVRLPPCPSTFFIVALPREPQARCGEGSSKNVDEKGRNLALRDSGEPRSLGSRGQRSWGIQRAVVKQSRVAGEAVPELGVESALTPSAG